MDVGPDVFNAVNLQQIIQTKAIVCDNIDASKQNDNAKQNKKQKRSQHMPKQCLGRALVIISEHYISDIITLYYLHISGLYNVLT